MEAVIGSVIALFTAGFKMGVDIGAMIIGGIAAMWQKIYSMTGHFLGMIVSAVQNSVKVVLQGAVDAYNKVAELLHWEPVELEMKGDWGAQVEDAFRKTGDVFGNFAERTWKARDKSFDAIRPWDAYAWEMAKEGGQSAWDGVKGIPAALDQSEAAGKWVDGIAGKIMRWADGLAGSKPGAAGERKPGGIGDAKAGDIVGDRSITRNVDSLAKVGLYNFSRSAEDNLDLRRNNLLEAIRNGIDRMAGKERSGPSAALPALGSV